FFFPKYHSVSIVRIIYIYCVCIYTHYIAKRIGALLKIIGFRCSNHLHGHRHEDWFSTNICERMGYSKELSEFKRGTVIGCHLCNKSIHEISLLLNIPRSSVSGNITKWKKPGTTETQHEVVGHIK
ncbi:unnamed protein product, partial [Staurois parvus]